MFNRVILSGRLTADPDLRTSTVPYLRFTIAVNNPYSRNQTTTFVTAIAWRNNATNMAKFLKRGSLILLEGQLQSNNTNFLEVSVSSVYFMDSKKNPTNSNTLNNATTTTKVMNDEKSSSKTSDSNLNPNFSNTSVEEKNDLKANNLQVETKVNNDEKQNVANEQSNAPKSEKEEGIDWDAV